MRLGFHARGQFIDDSTDSSPYNGRIMVTPMIDLPAVRETMQELNTTRGGQSCLERSEKISILPTSNKTIQGVGSPKEAQTPRQSLSHHSLSQKLRPRERLWLKGSLLNLSYSSVLNNMNLHDLSPDGHQIVKLDSEREFQLASKVQGRSLGLKLVPLTEISTQKPSSSSKASQVFDLMPGSSLKLRPTLQSTKVFEDGRAEVNTKKQFSPPLAKRTSFGSASNLNSSAVRSPLAKLLVKVGESTSPVRRMDNICLAPSTKITARMAVKPRLQHLMPALGDLEGRVSVIDNSLKGSLSKIESFGFDIENVPVNETFGNTRRGSSASVSAHRNSLASASVRTRNLKKSTLGTFIRSNTNGESIFQFVHEGQIPQFMESIAFDGTSGHPSTTPKYSLFFQTPSDKIANPHVTRGFMKLDTIFDVEGELKKADLLKKYIESKMMLRKEVPGNSLAYVQPSRIMGNRSSQPKLSIYQPKVNLSKQESSSMIDDSNLAPSDLTRRAPQKHSEAHLSPQQPRRLQLARRQLSQDSSRLNQSQLTSEPCVTMDNPPACFKNAFRRCREEPVPAP